MIFHCRSFLLDQKKHEFIPILYAPIVKHLQELFFLASNLIKTFTIVFMTCKGLQPIVKHQQAVHRMSK